jgi:hypothetical protein
VVDCSQMAWAIPDVLRAFAGERFVFSATKRSAVDCCGEFSEFSGESVLGAEHLVEEGHDDAAVDPFQEGILLDQLEGSVGGFSFGGGELGFLGSARRVD